MTESEAKCQSATRLQGASSQLASAGRAEDNTEKVCNRSALGEDSLLSLDAVLLRFSDVRHRTSPELISMSSLPWEISHCQPCCKEFSPTNVIVGLLLDVLDVAPLAFAPQALKAL
jgi:hypothetical protein